MSRPVANHSTGPRVTQRRRRTATTALAGGLALGLTIPAAVAHASEPDVIQIADGFAGPLQIAVGTDGTIYVGQAFGGTLTALDKKGGRHDLATGVNGGEIAGVDAKGKGTVVYTSSDATEFAPATYSVLNRVQPNGHTRGLADLLDYETTANPDQVNVYGFVPALPDDCPWPADFGPATYDGLIDTHPYAVAIDSGGYYVADAAGNDIVRVDANGRRTTVAVLPSQPFVVSAEQAAEYGLDPCVIGRTLYAEPVPTDVEIGSNGMLYVTTLSGSDNIGSVYEVNPVTGASSMLATGFVSATNLAIGSDGTIYVAELFADRVSRIEGGVPVTVADVPNPAGLEFAKGKLFVSYDVFGNGKVGTITL